jgi:hypothetical protein
MLLLKVLLILSDGDLWYNTTAGTVTSGWTGITGTVVAVNDRLIYNGTIWSILPTPALWVQSGNTLSPVNSSSKVTSVGTSSSDNDNVLTTKKYVDDGIASLSASDKLKLDSVEQGAQVNVNPTQSYASASTTGQLTLSPGGNATTLPQATGSAAGLMSATDKTTLDNLVANPGGVVSIVAGDGIIVNTANAPGSAGTPEINVAFGDTPNGTPTQVMPFDITVLSYLP